VSGTEGGTLADRLAESPLLSGVRAALAEGPAGAGGRWLVGGAVRDALLGREIDDLDIAVEGDASATARALAGALGGAAFELSDEFETWRVGGPGGAWTVDVAALRAPSLEADLALRDFTVNAIALPLASGAAPEPIDPLGGAGDLREGVLRLAAPSAFDDDPLRLMRMARMAAEFGLTPDDATLAAAKQRAARAAEPAGERRFAELRGMMAGADPLRALALLEEAELTPVVLPQLAALRGVGQSANHHLDVYDHTIEVLRRWLEIEQDLPTYAGTVAAEVEAALAEPLADELTRRDGIRFAAILHDVGKPATRTERDGFVGFRGHDSVGAEMILELGRELRTSRRFARYEAAIAEHHLVLGFMTHERPLPRRRIWDYLSLTGREALDVTMLTVADRLSARGAGVPEAAIEAHLDLAREMLAEIVALERDGAPAPLLDGTAIGELLEVSGPLIGEAVAELAAAQFAGEVETRDDAERHLQEWSETL
jgi:putative nucleotidyltransferase with HDIG domain